jgi:hypothetical protein
MQAQPATMQGTSQAMVYTVAGQSPRQWVLAMPAMNQAATMGKCNHLSRRAA